MVCLRNFLLLCFLCISNGLRTRIMNGHDASEGEFKYQVSIQVLNSTLHFCGGSILNKRYVITAAHCTQTKNVVLEANQIQVATGLIHTKPDSIHRVIEIIRHEHYNISNNVINDIALLKVKIPFDFTKTEPVNLPKPGSQLQVGSEAVVSGWGSTSYPEMTVPERLRKVSVEIINNHECNSSYQVISMNIYPTHLCTLIISDVPRGACSGDSGGPLVINKNELIGIVSWSFKDPSCASPKFPNVYTRVSEYVDWIEEHGKPYDDSKITFPDD